MLNCLIPDFPFLFIVQSLASFRGVFAKYIHIYVPSFYIVHIDIIIDAVCAVCCPHAFFMYKVNCFRSLHLIFMLIRLAIMNVAAPNWILFLSLHFSSWFGKVKNGRKWNATHWHTQDLLLKTKLIVESDNIVKRLKYHVRYAQHFFLRKQKIFKWKFIAQLASCTWTKRSIYEKLHFAK